MLKFCDFDDCGRLFQILADALMLDHQAFFSIVVNGLPTGYWCLSGGFMSKSSWWRPYFLNNWGRVHECTWNRAYSNLEIDSQLNRQPVKTYKWQCDLFIFWQWAHQSDCRVCIHWSLLRFVPYNRLLQYSILVITIAWTIEFPSS